jgi:pimeloyl-ACP methyl ester carboxylesterase
MSVAPPSSAEALRRDLDLEAGMVGLLQAGDGPELVFLHGAGGAGSWTDFHRCLSRRFRVIAPDHPGFGHSGDFPAVEDMGDLVYHYLDVFDRLGLRSPIVVGASFGGWIAAELAVHSPARVSRLVLLAPVGLRIPGRPIADLFLMNAEEKAAALYHDQQVGRQCVPGASDIDLVVRRYRDDSALARFCWNPFFANPKLERRLHRVTAPTRVIAAGQDKVLPIEHCQRYAEKIPGAALDVVDDCGHALYMECPERLAQVVIDCLEADAEG